MSRKIELTGGETLNSILRDKDNHLGKMIAANESDAKIIEALYWGTLTRPPSETEAGAMQKHIDRANDRRQALEDIAWSLLNAKAFMLSN